MKIITVEEHFDTTANIENFNAHSKVPNNNPYQTKLKNDLTDMKTRLAYMDENGIDMQVISEAGNSPQVLPDDLSVDGCKEQNDTIAKEISPYPTRLAALASLPANVPGAAADELERAVKQLGLKGGIISGTVNGQFLDNKKFEPIFAKAEELDVPLYLHPGVITNEQRAMLYDSTAYSSMMGNMMAGAAWGWHMEEGIQTVRLIFSGLMEKYPNLKIVNGHWGEFVPMFVERLDGFTQFSGNDLPHSFSYYYRRNIYVTPSGMLTNPQLELVRTEMGADHMLHAEDFPYLKRGKEVKSFIENASLSNGEKEAFAHGTAEKLFKL